MPVQQTPEPTAPPPESPPQTPGPEPTAPPTEAPNLPGDVDVPSPTPRD
jgi:hypothetical protein